MFWRKGCLLTWFLHPLLPPGAIVTNYSLAQDAGKFMLRKNLSDQLVSWRQRRRLEMPVAITPTASQLTRIGNMPSAECRIEANNCSACLAPN